MRMIPNPTRNGVGEIARFHGTEPARTVSDSEVHQPRFVASCSPNVKQATPRTRKIDPTMSKPFSLKSAGTIETVARTPMIAIIMIGTLMRNAQRHENSVARNSPSRGPSAIADPMTAVHKENARTLERPPGSWWLRMWRRRPPLLGVRLLHILTHHGPDSRGRTPSLARSLPSSGTLPGPGILP